jgi:hypothetical protein
MQHVKRQLIGTRKQSGEWPVKGTWTVGNKNK